MKNPVEKAQERPAETFAGFVAAVLTLLIAFGVNFTEEQVGAILLVVGFMPTLVTWIVERWRSTR